MHLPQPGTDGLSVGESVSQYALKNALHAKAIEQL
jgi:hypothetical protein